MDTKLQSPSMTSRKSFRGKDPRREPRSCRPHPCMANALPTTPKYASGDRYDGSERIIKMSDSDSPCSETSAEMMPSGGSPSKSKHKDLKVTRKRAPSKRRSQQTSSDQLEGDSPSSTESSTLDSSQRTQKQTKSSSSAKNERTERRVKPAARSKPTESNTQHSNRIKSFLERSHSERMSSKASTFHDSDTFTLESNYNEGPDVKPFLQLCFDGIEEAEPPNESDNLANQPVVVENDIKRREPPNRAISLRHIGGFRGCLDEKETESPPKRKVQSALDRRTQLQKSKSVSLRAVECISVRDMTNIITSDKVDNYGSMSNSSTVDETPSPSASSFPYEPSIGSEDPDENGNRGGRKLVASGIFKSLSLSHSRSAHGSLSTSLHNETPRMSLHKRSTHKKMSLKGPGETLSMLSQKLFVPTDDASSSRKKVWGSSSERRERSLSAALQGLGTKSAHNDSSRPGLKRMESANSMSSYAPSVISCSTIDRRRLLERSKSTTSVASFSITPSLRGQNSEHLRTVNAFVFDSARPFTQESRDSLHALLTDSIDLVEQAEAPPVLEKYRGVSGDELVELMKNCSQQLNATMHVC